MSFWQEEYQLDIPLIDLQHKRLFELIDELDQHLQDDSIEFLQGILQELRHYTEYHFETEEDLFRASPYDEADEHCAQHQKFREAVESQYERLLDGSREVRLEARLFLQNWWSFHVLDADRGYAPYLITGHQD